MTVQEMRLHSEPFHKIAEGIKTIEVRLNDTKRRTMRIGDRIEFSLRTDPKERFQAEIIGLDAFDSFRDTYAAYPPELYGAESAESWQSMYQYYSPEEEAENGVLSIRVKRLD